MSNTYNGHANYETWLAHLYEIPEAIAQEYMEADKKPDLEELDTFCLDWFEEYYDCHVQIATLPLLMQDILSAAVTDIDWREVAETVKDMLVERLLKKEEIEHGN